MLTQAPPVSHTSHITNQMTTLKWISFHLSSCWCRCVNASRWRDQITGTTSCLRAFPPWSLTTRMTTYSRRHSESPISFTWILNREFLIIFSLIIVRNIQLFPVIISDCPEAPSGRSVAWWIVIQPEREALEELYSAFQIFPGCSAIRHWDWIRCIAKQCYDDCFVHIIWPQHCCRTIPKSFRCDSNYFFARLRQIDSPAFIWLLILTWP